MAVKISSLVNFIRIPKWVNIRACVFSSSCEIYVENFPENNRNLPDSSEFEQNIEFLRNKLVPDSLIQVLDNTSNLNSAVKIFKWAGLQKRFSHTTDTYYRIILKLGMAGNILDMEAFCQNMMKDRCPGAEEALVGLIDTFVRHSRLSEAMRVLANMNLGGYKPSLDIFNVLLGALVKENGDFRDALFVYKEMVKAGILPTVQTLNYLLEALFEANLVKLALDQFKRMNKKGCSPNSRTFEILVKGLIAKDQVDEANSVIEEMLKLGCQPDLRFYTCSIPLFCRENKVEEGIRLFKMMRASNFVPDSFTYGVIIQCLCKNLRLDCAINILNEMTEGGISLAHDVFVDLVHCFCELGNIDEAIMFLEDKHVLETPPYNALLEGCCNADGSVRKHEIRKAFELLGRMIISSFILDCSTYSALIVGNCKLSKYDDALALYHQVQARYWVLESRSYSELVEGLCQVSRAQKAAEVFHYMSMKRIYLHSVSFYSLVKCLCDLGQVSEAIRLQQLTYYSGTSCSNVTYTTIMCGLSRSEKAKYLLVLLSKMLVEGCKLDLEAYCILIESMIEQNRVKDCVLLFNMMVKEGFIPDSERLFDQLSFIANQAQLCMVSSAVDKLLFSCGYLNSTMYNLLINGFWKEGNKKEASRLLDLMLEKGWVPDPATHKLLIGSDVKEKRVQEILVYDDSYQKMALRRLCGFSDAELMSAKPCSRLMRQTAGIFTVGGGLGFWILYRLHYGPRITVPRSLRWAGCGAVTVSSTTGLLVRLFSPECEPHNIAAYDKKK
ncbi:Pentatricopeptide repeat-containing protein [Quillaja saponaria]|uniref:Pentatricopeptide repeat-containing protein n=1 Tax=Quillaja saponaria TaxID=32244 RepID=A0AAD7Q1T5_QUISA|nr:Pentatricopeptide repeat-containing protein [Quillaja saponaria]